MAVAGSAEVHDLGEDFRRDEAPAHTERRGQKPLLIQCDDSDGELDEIAAQVGLFSELHDVDAGDVAVLVATNRLAKAALRGLAARGIECMDLDRYEGKPIDEVKVGTFHRAKGLEFKVVFVPSLGSDDFPPAVRSEAESDERAGLALSQLFVAMTRARDALIILHSAEPAAALAQARRSFQIGEPSAVLAEAEAQESER